VRVHLQPAYLLHRRPFRDNTEVAELFCAEQGRMAVLARGMARRRRGGALSALLQPFQPLLVSYSGRGELPALTGVEGAGALPPLVGEALLSGFYLNELLLRLLERGQAQSSLFTAYGSALGELSDRGPGDVEPILRSFEFELLRELGYAVDFTREAGSGVPLRGDYHYRLVPEQGFYVAEEVREHGDGSDRFSGEALLAVASGRFEGSVAPVAKRLVRVLLHPHLGPRPLRSREMFRSWRGRVAAS
jgi:DNA repair protein RecO (recombination protein O)